jgi:hypothetical protein
MTWPVRVSRSYGGGSSRQPVPFASSVFCGYSGERRTLTGRGHASRSDRSRWFIESEGAAS